MKEAVNWCISGKFSPVGTQAYTSSFIEEAILNFFISITVPLNGHVHSRTIHLRTERFEQGTFHIWGTLSKLPRRSLHKILFLYAILYHSFIHCNEWSVIYRGSNS